ncbi:hypothetical protein LGN17_13390 [Burkholderia sp. AU30280]|uniref:hypothetical protein n=1 Tax=unclassified Burkholderia TaxID=2613784 RepID=UPI001CF492AF|nr:hypothetical protein [Burkholderia sp. AU30280]MCA8273498.1 hypothetical protein [Burkholderia sp. AU30280]
MSAVVDCNYNVVDFLYPEALARYEHEGVIGKFRDEWDVEEVEAIDIFSETKKFLFVSEYAQKQCVEFEVDEPILMIDKMWHHFILFTKDYEKFCHHFFGKTLHHIPFCSAHLAQKIKKLVQSGTTLKDHNRARLEQQLNFIGSTFGDETLRKWYVEYGEKYSLKKMNVLKRSINHGAPDKSGVSMNLQSILGMTSGELISEIVKKSEITMGCGRRGCGMYCTCNSSRDLYA